MTGSWTFAWVCKALGERTAQSQLRGPGACISSSPYRSYLLDSALGLAPEEVSLPSRAGPLWRATKASGFMSYEPVTSTRSSLLNLSLPCKTDPGCLAGFVTQVFNETCGAAGGWNGVALGCPPPPFSAQEAGG